jgi:hypothetical protein
MSRDFRWHITWFDAVLAAILLPAFVYGLVFFMRGDL